MLERVVRLAHASVLFRHMHQMHQRNERVRPLTLFALNPRENLGLGLLWLAVISIYPASWLGMSIYLMLNVAGGAIGHLGVEPVPVKWAQQPGIWSIAGSSFHAQHHQDEQYDFGFYTLIRDRLFGTLRAGWAKNYDRLLREQPAEAQS